MKHRRAVGIARVMSLAIVVVSCSRGERASEDTVTNRPGAVQQLAAAPRQISGELTKPIDQYTGDELYTFVRALDFTGGVERERRCRNGAACVGANARTRLRVDAVADGDSLSPTSVTQFGVIAVRATNGGGAADAMYGMQPGARYEYYLIVMPGGVGGSATWQLRELQVVGNTRTHRQLNSGRFVECGHPFVRGARADFRTCAEAAEVRQASFGALLQEGEAPIWVGCAGGCCTSETGGDA